MATVKKLQKITTNLLTWQRLIVPDNPPYDKGAFRIKINFPAKYPFKPPKITFKTKIYHLNIDEKGQVCLPVITLVKDPQPKHPLQADLAEKYSKDCKKIL
ncbi:unnamed protein product [Nyctereutes procyonoides]|uniref:(raccoon dog) hypothetical protein n=1 Tax=Nyctereutes procyonoides TaxID=34880 RepID=A0A811YYV7_NYCPR|nr:unnamed protein product [Nyctereutes procyonoides]